MRRESRAGHLTGMVRQDIRSSFGGLSGTADVVPLSIVLSTLSASTCAPLATTRCTCGTAIDWDTAAYAASRYTGNAANLSRVSLASDMVFSDGSALELATIGGSVSDGLAATLTVAI